MGSQGGQRGLGGWYLQRGCCFIENGKELLMSSCLRGLIFCKTEAWADLRLAQVLGGFIAELQTVI